MIEKHKYIQLFGQVIREQGHSSLILFLLVGQ